MMTGRRFGWLLLLVGLAAFLVGQLWLLVAAPSEVVSWLAVVGATAAVAGTFLFSAPASGVRAPLALATLLVCVIMVGGFALALILPAESAAGPLWLELPRRAAIVLVGVGLLPALVLPWAYWRDAARDPLDEGEVARLVAECERARQQDDKN